MATSERWLSGVGLGMTLWQGEYDGMQGTWLRWYSKDGQVLATGFEAVEQERQRAERLAAHLRQLGVDPDSRA